jgi:lambda family phage minor tail protein L
MTVALEKQKLNMGKRVELFEADFTNLGGTISYWVSSYAAAQPLEWKGQAYTPVPIEASGFETTGKGTLPTPTLLISNILLLPATIINALGDPLGSKITRWVTYETYLDNGATPDPNQHFLPDIYVIERKVQQNKISVEFELSAIIDQQGKLLPGRQVLKDTCTHLYRLATATMDVFDYTKATCPWAGSDSAEGGTETPYFTEAGVSTPTWSLDKCGKKLTDCSIRFAGLTPKQPLPFRGFPSVGKIK